MFSKTTARHATLTLLLAGSGALFGGCVEPGAPPDDQQTNSVSLTAGATNLVTNGGFESGLTGWTDWGGMAAGLEGTDVHAGTKAMKIALGDGGGGYNVAASGQTSLNVGAWIKVSVAGESAYFGVDCFSSSGTKLSHKSVGPFGYTSWTYSTAVVSIPTGTTRMTVWIYHNPGSGAAFFDDVELFSSAPPATSYTITASAGANGAISPSGAVSVAQGASQTFTITPASGYNVAAVTVDGVNQGALTSYTFTNVTAAHTISATFVASSVSYTITASAGANGTISPPGAVSVPQGTSKTFTITPASGYGVAGVTVDGVGQGAITTYTFTNVTVAHTISASFAALPPPSNLDGASTKAYNWMVSTLTPGGLYNSQSDDTVCYTYDQAVTVVAFLIKGDNARARALLQKLQALQQTDGSWYTGFDRNGNVSDGKQKWLGPMMWVDIAAANYRKYTGSTEFDAMAKKNLDMAIKTQRSNGALEIGQGQGTEENSDAYAALMAFGYTTQAAKVATFLNSMWNTTQKRFNAGAGDTTVYLDPQTWGNQALGSAGPAEAPKALDFVMAQLRTTKSNLSNTYSVDGFDFNGDKDDIWLEGTAQMASAFYTVGRPADGDYFAAQVAKSQATNGAIPYSVRGGTTGDGWNMTTAAALSSSGWFIIAVSKINPFKM